MIYKSLLPIIIALLVMIVITQHLISYVNHETNKALILENEYLLTVNVFRQLNKTIKPIMQNYACKLIINPLNYDCTFLANNITEIVANELIDISNKTEGLVRYSIINYGVYGKGNKTIYYAVIRAITFNNSITGIIGSSYPLNLCLYSQYMIELINALNSINNTTYFINNITEVPHTLNNEILSKIRSVGSGNAKITIYYEGVFSMISKSYNYTGYSGNIYYVINAVPINAYGCRDGTTYSGNLHDIVYVKGFINNTYYFSVNGIININN